MILLFVLAMQVARPLPTIQFNARVEAREVVIEQSGTATLTVRAEPDAGSRVDVVKRPEARGARTIRNFRADIDARAVIADPRQPLDLSSQSQDGEAPRPDGG